MPAALYEGALIYRNFDKQFLSLLKGNSARRSIDVQWKLCISEDGFELTASDETNISATQKIGLKLEAARNIDSRKLEATLEKTGNTIFKAAGISVFNQQSLYLPPAVLTEARRTILDQLLQKRTEAHRREECYWKQTDCPFPKTDLDYTANVVNNAATSFYRQHGATVTDKGYEISHRSRVPLMFCRHCIKYLIGACPKEDNHRRKDLKEPLFLVSGKWRLQLEFDCRQCEMRLTEV
jgi:putative protease